MKAVIAYEGLYFFEGTYFWRPLNVWIPYIWNTGFTMLLKNGQKEAGSWYISEEKKQKKNQNSIIIRISVVGKGTAFPVTLKWGNV